MSDVSEDHAFERAFHQENTIKRDYCSIIQKELNQLNHIYEQTQVPHDYQRHFTDLFPITCPNCGKIYHNRSDYLMHTTSPKEGALSFTEEGLQELRKCSCGQTLTLWSKDSDRRDCSYLGFLRRVLFENCLRKLTSVHPQVEKETLKNHLRFYFREQASQKAAS